MAKRVLVYDSLVIFGEESNVDTAHRAVSERRVLLDFFWMLPTLYTPWIQTQDN